MIYFGFLVSSVINRSLYNGGDTVFDYFVGHQSSLKLIKFIGPGTKYNGKIGQTTVKEAKFNFTTQKKEIRQYIEENYVPEATENEN